MALGLHSRFYLLLTQLRGSEADGAWNSTYSTGLAIVDLQVDRIPVLKLTTAYEASTTLWHYAEHQPLAGKRKRQTKNQNADAIRVTLRISHVTSLHWAVSIAPLTPRLPHPHPQSRAFLAVSEKMETMRNPCYRLHPRLPGRYQRGPLI